MGAPCPWLLCYGRQFCVYSIAVVNNLITPMHWPITWGVLDRVGNLGQRVAAWVIAVLLWAESLYTPQTWLVSVARPVSAVPLENITSVTSVSDVKSITLSWELGGVAEGAVMSSCVKAVLWLPTVSNDECAHKKRKSTSEELITAVKKLTEILDQIVPAVLRDVFNAFGRMERPKLIETMAHRGTNLMLTTYHWPLSFIHGFINIWG